MYEYEVHIVGYAGSDLSNGPSAFFLNQVTRSDGGFVAIATVETNKASKALALFNEACEWADEQLTATPTFGARVSLEQLRQSLEFNDQGALGPRPFVSFRRPHPLPFQYSSSLSGWDIHLDGHFRPEVREFLISQAYVVVDYISKTGERLTTLTTHFFSEEGCIEEYEGVTSFISRAKGFTGCIYWERPLGFRLYGNVVPRPVALR